MEVVRALLFCLAVLLAAVEGVPKYDDFQQNGHTYKLAEKILKDATKKQANRHQKERAWQHEQHKTKQKADLTARKSDRARKRRKVKESVRKASERARASHRGGHAL